MIHVINLDNNKKKEGDYMNYVYNFFPSIEKIEYVYDELQNYGTTSFDDKQIAFIFAKHQDAIDALKEENDRQSKFIEFLKNEINVFEYKLQTTIDKANFFDNLLSAVNSNDSIKSEWDRLIVLLKLTTDSNQL